MFTRWESPSQISLVDFQVVEMTAVCFVHGHPYPYSTWNMKMKWFSVIYLSRLC